MFAVTQICLRIPLYIMALYSHISDFKKSNNPPIGPVVKQVYFGQMSVLSQKKIDFFD
jgi:effector-binding domain-containing protein